MAFARYQAAGACTGRAQPGAIALLAWATNDFGQGAYNLGIYVCRRVRGKPTRSVHGEGRALDIGFRTIGGRANPAGTRLVNALLPHVGRLGIQMIIWNRTVWSAKSPRGARYTGVHPHYDHIHIELSWDAARRLNLATIRSIMRGANVGIPPAQPKPQPIPEPPPEDEEEMKPQVIAHHESAGGGVWLHQGLFRVKLNTGPTHKENADRINFWKFLCEGRYADLTKKPAESKRFIEATVDVTHINTTALLSIYMRNLMDKIATTLKVKK